MAVNRSLAVPAPARTRRLGAAPRALLAAAAASLALASFAAPARAAPGDLDTSFNATGKQVLDLGSAAVESSASGVALDGSGRAVAVGTSGGDIALARYTAAGVLDTTFGGGDGTVVTDVDPAFDSVDTGNAVAIDSQGRIVIAGASNGDFEIARYLATGTLDLDLQVDLGGSDEASGVAIGAADSIVVAGTTDANGSEDLAAVRLDSSGSPDPAFDGDGQAIVDTTGSDEEGHAVAVDSSGRVVIAGSTHQTSGTTDFAVTRLTHAGAVDVQRSVDYGGFDEANAVAVDGSGNIVAAGTATGTDTDLLVARITAAGSFDPTFGAPNGYVRHDLGGAESANGVAVDAAARVVVGGTSTAGSGPDFAVARLTSTGALDATFSADGWALADIGNPGPSSSVDSGNAVALDGTKVVLAGGAEGPVGVDEFALARFDLVGSLDSAYGSGGKVRTPLAVDSTDTAKGVAVDSSDRTLVAGTSNASTGSVGLFLARYAVNGSLDTTFSGDGKTGSYEQTIPGGVSDVGDVAVSGSRILVAFTTVAGQFGVAAFDSSGTVDSSFGAGGVATADFQAGAGLQKATSIVVDGSGRVVLAGWTNGPASGDDDDFALARFTATGALDLAFDGDGKQTTDFSATADDIAFDVAIDGAGRIVLAGSTFATTPFAVDVALARYSGADGSLDPAFDGDGRRTDNLAGSGESTDLANGVAVDSGNRVVVAATSDPTTDQDFAVLRYTSAGAPDTSFSGDGRVFSDFNGVSEPDGARAVGIDSNGNVVAAGYEGAGDSNFAMVRYTTTGAEDSGFGGGDARVSTDFGNEERAADLAFTSGGKVVLAGPTTSFSLDTEDAAVARYLGGAGAAGQQALQVSKASVAGGSGTVTSAPAGISCGGTCSASFSDGQTVTLTASSGNSLPATWQGCDSVNGSNQCVLAMNADRNVTATFKRPTLTAARAGTGSGTIASSPAGINCDSSASPDCSEPYDNGTSVVLTASAGSSSTFAGWQGCASTSGTQCTVAVDADKTATATFDTIVPQFSLSVGKTGTGAAAGLVTSTPSGISCGSTCQHSFDENTVVDLSANAGPNNTFTAWSGEGCSGTGSCQVTMSQARSVSAGFVLDQHSLTVSRGGSGGGGVTSSPAGINCAGGTPDCSESYDHGTSVTLTASADSGSRFSGWSGGGCSGTGTCQVTVNATTAVSANFALQRQLDLAKSGNGSGTVTSSPAGITCGATCQASFDDGQSVVLTAAPGANSSFGGWTVTGSPGACPGTGTCTVAMDAAKSVSAAFALVQRQLTVDVSGSGTVSSTPTGINSCATAGCTASYDHGTSVTLTASPGAGQIVEFSGCGSQPAANQCTVAMTSAKTIAADFRQPQLSVALAGTGTGTVASTPSGIACQPTCIASFDSGTEVTLTATPSGGSTFAGWSGACTGTADCVVDLDGDSGVFATFVAPSTGGGGGGGGGGAPASPPNTSLGAAKVKAKARKATFKFTGAGGSGALSFECKLDRKPFAACTSPKKYNNLKPGKHTFQARAKDGSGQSDSSPVTKKFKIPKRR